jgi:DNA gyrase subunit B
MLVTPSCKSNLQQQQDTLVRKAREMVQRKTVMVVACQVKLSDCSETDPTLCEVFLVEG